MKRIALAFLALVAGSMAAHANVLTVNTLAANQQFQQTTNNPCIIGEASCQNPATFPSTTLPAGASSYDALSPVYTVAQLMTVLGGNTVVLGYDINQTSTVQTLNLITMSVNGAVVDSTQLGANGLQVPPTAGGNNGNGYADYTITGFTSLANYAATAQVQFHFVQSVANDGREQLFLIHTPSTATPEPLTMSTVGAGLLALGVMRFRRRKQSV
jgi:hypothetical protein